MKLDKPTNSAFSLLGLLLASWLLVSCGGTTKKNVEAKQPGEDTTLRVRSSEAYLPIDSFDELGQKLPYQKAVNPYTSASEPIEKASIDLYIAARRAFKAQQYDKAQGLLEKLVEQDKTLSGPLVLLGDIARVKSAYGKAIDHYKSAIAINSVNTNAYLRLALVYRMQGEFTRAQNTYVKALSIWKDFPEAHLNLAVLYDLYLDKPLKAQQHLEAYEFLLGNKTRKVTEWLSEIRSRTKVDYSIQAGKPLTQSASVAGGGEK